MKPAARLVAMLVAFSPLESRAAGVRTLAEVASSGPVIIVIVMGAVLIAGLAVGWWALRRKSVHQRAVSAVLEAADCLLWQAQTVVSGDDVEWTIWLQPTALSRRLFADREVPKRRGLWIGWELPEQAEMDVRSRTAMQRGDPGYEQEFRVVAGGRTVWLRERVAIQPIAPNRFWLVGLVTDITSQREADTARRASEAQLQRVLETAEFLLWHARVLQDPDGTFRWEMNVPKSQLHQRVFGRDVNDPQLMPWRELVSNAVYDEMVQRADNAIMSGAPGYEQTIRGERDGLVLWLHEEATIRRAGPAEWHLVGIITDVTTRQVAEEERQASERALREILERADCMLWRATVVNRDGSMHWMNFSLPVSRLSLELFGDRPPLRDTELWDRMDVPDLAGMNRRSSEAILAGSSGYEQEFQANREGRTYWLHEQVSIRPATPNEWHLVGVITDVTQRHEALEAQRQSEMRLEELLQRADCLIWEGEVTRTPDQKLLWRLHAPKSRLHRKLFGRDPEGPGFPWSELNVPEFDEMARTAAAALASDAPGYEHVFRIPKPEGTIWINEQVTITRAGTDRWEVVGVIMDITARREAEEARRQTEAQLRSILELADCMVWQATVVERDGRLIWDTYTPYSYMYRRLFGTQVWDGCLDWGRINVPEYSEIAARSSIAIREHRAGYDQEFRIVTPERVIWVREVVTIQAAGGGEHKLVGVITDITPQREAQEAKRASVAQVEQLLSGADCMLWQARVFEVSAGMLRWVMFLPRSHLHRELFGRDPSYPFNLNWAEIVGAACEKEIAVRADQAIRSGGAGYEQEFRAQRDDRVFWLHESVTISSVGPGEWELVGIVTDLSARRAAEQAVRASEERFRTLYEHSPVAIVEADFSAIGRWLDDLREKGPLDLAAYLDAEPGQLMRAARKFRFVDCNEAALRILRAKSKAEFRRRHRVLGTPESLVAIKKIILSMWERRNSFEADLRLLDFDGQAHEMSLRWWMERNDGGLDYRRASMVLVDLTELKQAELALAAEKERLSVTLRAMAEGVITTDTNGCVQFMNQAAAAFTRCDPLLAVGWPVDDVCHFANDRTGEPVEVPVARVAQGDVLLELPPRTRLKAPGGKSRLIEGCCAPVRSLKSEVIGIVLVFRDVTEHERLEQELVRATKLESVGILAGGIAHDFNNILTAIMGNIALAALDIDPNTEAGRALRQGEKATLRARDLTQQLLTFAKGGEPVRAAVHLDGIVREMTSFTLHGSNVSAQYDIAPDLWPADADKGQIGRVVQNLVLNAVQAMPDGGRITIKISNEHVAALTTSTLVPGDYVHIAISDTGAGIKAEHLSRIFDPYFTTKQSGSGLGLAAVYSIVTKHRGVIDVQSKPGEGTTFRIWLPATPAAPAQAGITGGTEHGVKLGGRLLFMDDEEPIRQMAAFLLRRFGFDVVCANDGADAVTKFRAAHDQGQPFALVIMDLTVPGGVGGREAIAELRKIDPAVRAIVSSGYSSDPVLANYRSHGFAGVAAKPYDINDLARVLREVMEE